MSELVALARRLVNIASLSGEEAEAARFVAAHLAELGYAVEVFEAAPHRPNVLATTDRPPRVVLSTHLDTVPPHLPAREEHGFLYGRGACDAKGIIAAQITAAERLRAEGVGEIGLLFVVDEEMGSAGARADLQIRLVTDAAPVRQLLERTVDGRARIEYLSAVNPVRLTTVPGFETCVVRFTTDIPHLANWGSPLLIGPGSILDAHTAHERISLEELAAGADMYVRLVRALLCGNGTA